MRDTQQQMASVEELEAELIGMDARIEDAALGGSMDQFVKLLMRQKALPVLVRRAKARPIRQEIARLEKELAALDEESLLVREAPPPEVPERLGAQITPTMMKNRRLANVNDQASRVGRELKEKQRELAQIEGEGPRELY